MKPLKCIWTSCQKLICKNTIRVIIVILLCGAHIPCAAQQDCLFINEIQVCNTDQTIDPSYNYGSWVELYNSGTESITIGGKYISDDANNLMKHKLSIVLSSVKPNNYLTIWFDHHSSQGTYGGKSSSQVPFKLDPEGGSIYLSDADGNIMAQADYPPATPRCSYARITDGADEWGTTAQPTPTASNNGSTFATTRLAAPVVSRDGGVYEVGQKFTFNVSVPTGAKLIYTTDGSTPTLNNGQVASSKSFTVSGTSIYRFAAFRDGYLPSPVVSRSFIFKNHDYYLPVLSLTTDPKNLFDKTIGIYCSGSNGISGNGQNSAKNWNMDWERPVNIEYMVPEKNQDGETSFVTHINQELDMEICGGWSRGFGASTVDGKYWEMKAGFRLKCDKEYEGQTSLDYPIFPLKPYNKYKVWQVRNGGNDNYACIKDAALSQFVMRTDYDIDAQDCQPAHVFFNGQYVGMFNIRESNNRHYGYSNWGIDTDDMDQFDLSNATYNQKVGDNVAWKELVALAKQLNSSKDESIYKQICERLDIDEYANYMAYCCSLSPSDWITNVNNTKGYRSRSDNGKFRFVLFDMDSAFETSNVLNQLISNNYNADVDDLFRYLISYDTFRRKFIDAFCLVDGSIFEPQRCSAIVSELYNERNKALSFEGRASNTNLASTIRSMHNGSNITNLKKSFSLNNGYKLTISSNLPEARLSVNDQLIPTGQFEGYLFNYKNNGIYLTAQAPAGYVFKGWFQNGYSGIDGITHEHMITFSDQWEYYDKGAVNSSAWCGEEYDATQDGWKEGKAPLGYCSAGKPMQSQINTTLSYGSNASNKRPTYYFRKRFYLEEEPSPNTTFQLNYRVDDGFRFYINGKDIDGYRCQAGCSYDYVTGDYAGDVPDEGSFTFPPDELHQGWNVLAVEVHNTSLSSSDIFWDAELVMTTEEEVEADIVCREATFGLSDFESEGTYNIEARFARITDERQLLQEGASPIRINEVSAANDIHINDYGKKNDWVELYNTTDQDIDVAGMYLSDKKKKPQKWQITSSESKASTVVPAHGSLIVWCDQLASVNQLHAPFKLDNADGACVSIQAEDGSWSDKLTYLEQPRRHTFGRYPDGAGFSSLLPQPTINKPNRLGTSVCLASDIPNIFNDDIYITIALAKGWNWTSHNLADDVHRSRFTGAAQRIVGYITEYFLDAESSSWLGDLDLLESGQGYKLQCKDEGEVILRGRPFAASETPVTLREGSNWLAFPLYSTTTLDAALTGFTPSDGDRIIALDEFATYEDGQWEGTLTSLQPGQAYIYESQGDNTLTWTALSAPSAQHRRYAAAMAREESAWTYDIHAYPNVMTIVGEVQADEANLDGNYLVGAFVGEECRGVGSVMDNRIYMNIHGEGGEVLSFRLLDASLDSYAARDTLQFSPQHHLGSPATPYVFNFNSHDIEDVIQSPSAPSSRIVATRYYQLNGQPLTSPRSSVSPIIIRKDYHSDGTVSVSKQHVY